MRKPLDILNRSLNSRVLVGLKGNKEYRGALVGYDPHMNLVLSGAEEFIEGSMRRKLDLILVRGDNVIYVSP